jgi:hypothetical protein
MFAAQLPDPRLAFLLLCILLIAAAIPIAFAWARVLPEEQPPFRFHRSSERATGDLTPAPEQADSRRDPFAVGLLVCVSLSYLWQLPGLPRDFVLLRIVHYVPEPWLQGLVLFRLVLFIKGFLVVMPGAGAVYSIFRRNQIRAPLIAAGILVPLIWLVLPWLRAALAAS